MGFDAAGTIVNDAAVELGLIAARLADPFSSTDNNIAQLCQFLKTAGRDIIREKQWTQNQAEYSFTTVLNTPSYALPPDFLRMIDQTYWDRTNRLPLGGPLSPQEWQYLKARQVGVVFTILFRPKLQKIYVYPDTGTPAGHVIAFEYMSSYWVQPSGQVAATADAPTASTDLIIFESLLMLRAIKRLWLRAKGLDSSAAEEDYELTLEQTIGQDSSSPVLRMDGSKYAGDPLLGGANVPITGFGG